MKGIPRVKISKYHFISSVLKLINYLQSLHSLYISLLTITLLIKRGASKCCRGERAVILSVLYKAFARGEIPLIAGKTSGLCAAQAFVKILPTCSPVEESLLIN